MREIIFRGKSPITKEWIYGDLFQHGEQRFIMTGGHNIEVDPESVGQFTGTLDCYERKIYEGDILRYITDYDGLDGFARTVCARVVVVWNPEILGFACRIIGDDSGDFYSWLEMREIDDIKIIGNIYDKPRAVRGWDT